MKSLRYAGGCLLRYPLRRGELALAEDAGNGGDSLEEGGIHSIVKVIPSKKSYHNLVSVPKCYCSVGGMRIAYLL